MKQKLTNLAVGELVAVVVFWINFFLFKKLITTTKSLISISFSLFILSFILVQGSIFWCILIKRISKPGFAAKYTGKIYNKLKILDVILLCMGVLVIILNSSTFFTMIVSFAIWIFAVIEWVNYYKLQLSYSLNPVVLLKYIIQRKLRKSRIANEIDNSFDFEIYGETLEEAHKNFKTKIVDGQKTEFVPDGKPGIPPKNSKFSLVNYPSKLGEMPMYITAKENNGKKYPAIIYLNGGFGGIGDSEFGWDEESPKNNYQGADAFKRDDFVLAIPSVRGENANPGKYEMFYGEIEDLEEARKYVASLPYVDSNRIYLVGHSTGGTKTLLLSEYSKGFRAVFAMGALPDFFWATEKPDEYGGVPFDLTNPREIAVRSSLRYVRSITSPTFHFEGQEERRDILFEPMQKAADKYKIPFKKYRIAGGDHFNIIYPLTTMIAQKILTDTGAKTNIQFTAEDLEKISKNIVK